MEDKKHISGSGFTLVELLIAISILAILSVMGIVIFNGVQLKGRDAARRQDLDALVKALEVNHSVSGYAPLAPGQFASGSIPATDPKGNPYCGNKDQNVITANPVVWTATCPVEYNPISTTIPVPSSGSTTSWKVCISLESGGVVCRTNSQ